MHSDRAFHIYMALMVVGTFIPAKRPPIPLRGIVGLSGR